MYIAVQGEQVRLHFSSADASTAAAMSLYDANGVLRALATNERLLFWTVIIHVAATVNPCQIFDDKNNDGVVDVGEQLINVGGSIIAIPCYYAPEGLPCGPGRMPKVKGSAAGQIDVTGIGYIVKG